MTEPRAHHSFLLTAVLLGLALIPQIAKGECDFPENWSGEWFQSGMGGNGPVVITRQSVKHPTETKKCMEKGKANRYLVRDEEFDCYRCMVMNMKHPNVIQYKESYCDVYKPLRELCVSITGDAMLYSMFRLAAEPVSCPFHGPLTFTYAKGYDECKNPLSQVDSCADDSRLLFRHQACADVPSSEAFNEQLVCLASWKEGSNHYLVGKIDHLHAKNDEDRYRCFIFEKPRHADDQATWNLAQSADATCQGLISAHEGSKTMKLTKVSHGGKKCKFPSWLTTNRHWHTLDSTQSYYVYHKETSVRISNGTDMPEDLETRGSTDIKLVCQEYLSGDHHNHHKHRRGDHHNQPEHHGDNQEADQVTLIAHVTVGCKSGYQCIQIFRRDEHVVQVQTGDMAYVPEEACTHHYWNPRTANITTLVTTTTNQLAPVSRCGPFGKYRVSDNSRLSGCRSGDAQTFTQVHVGCSTEDTLELHTSCPQAQVDTYHCQGHWESEGVTYVVASPTSRPSGSPRRVCFTYTSTGDVSEGALDTYTMTARHDTCIPRQHDAHMAINATLSDECAKTARRKTSSGCQVSVSIWSLLLPAMLLLLLRLQTSSCVSLSHSSKVAL